MEKTIARLSIEQENCAQGAEFIPVSNNNGRRRHHRVLRRRIKFPKPSEGSKEEAMYRMLRECYRFEDLPYKFCARYYNKPCDAKNDFVYEFYKSRFLEPLNAIHKEVAGMLMCSMEDKAYDEVFLKVNFNENKEDAL